MRPDPTTASDDGSDGSSSGSSFAGPRQPPAPRIAGAGRRTTTRMPAQNAARHLPTTPTGSKPPRSGSTAIAANTTTTNMAVETNWSNVEDEHARRYDLTPVSAVSALTAARSPGGYTVDPWEAEEEDDEAEDDDEDMDEEEERPLEATTQQARNSRRGGMPSSPPVSDDSDAHYNGQGREQSVFILPGDIHPNMEHRETDIEQLRLFAGKLSADWKIPGGMAAPALARRIRDFQFAQEKRRKKYGNERPWGILGLYDHLSSIRTDVEWAEDAARRRANGEPYQSWADYDENKTSGSNRPFFTYFLLLVCTIMLIASIAVNGWKVAPLDENPMIGPSAETLVIMGAKDTNLIVNEHQEWRLLSSSVLHAGLVHFFINMLALWFVGAAIECSHGWVAALIIFVFSAVGGCILSAIFLPDFITVGASGGIFGFIGACLADILLNWKLLFCDFVTENTKRQSHIVVVAILVVDIGLNCIIGLTPYVDNFTHLGGMIYGFLCGMSTMERLSSDFFGMEEGCASRAKHFVLRFFGIILTVVSIVGTLVVLMQLDGTTTPCPACTWISCVPFPPWAPSDGKWWYCDDCGRVTADVVTVPTLHLDLDCPAGNVVTVDLTDEDDVSRTVLRKKLPTYCREYCTDPPASN